MDCAELDSQCEPSPSSDEGSVGPDVPPDKSMGRYGYLRYEEGLETVGTLQVLAKQIETPSSISNSNLLGPGFDSQVSWKVVARAAPCCQMEIKRGVKHEEKIF